MKNSTVARGYRLKISTHAQIRKIRQEMNQSNDKIISGAIKLLIRENKKLK